MTVFSMDFGHLAGCLLWSMFWFRLGLCAVESALEDFSHD